MALVNDPNNIRLAMLGRVMAASGYPVIPWYLGTQPAGALGIGNAKVTHAWCNQAHGHERRDSLGLYQHLKAYFPEPEPSG
jgi:hypothetical protein